MGVILNVYRTRSDWPSDDASATIDRITVINVNGPFKPDDEAPAYILEPHDYYPKYPTLSPVDPKTGQTLGGQASGNYAGCSDGRWVDAVAAITGIRVVDLVPIHDRLESKGGAE